MKRIMFLLLLGAFLFQAIGSMRLKSITHDETTHIASGYSALKTGDLRLNRQHPPFARAGYSFYLFKFPQAPVR